MGAFGHEPWASGHELHFAGIAALASEPNDLSTDAIGRSFALLTGCEHRVIVEIPPHTMVQKLLGTS